MKFFGILFWIMHPTTYLVGCVIQKRYTLPGWDSVGQGLTEHEWGILYSNVYGQLFCAVDIELS